MGHVLTGDPQLSTHIAGICTAHKKGGIFTRAKGLRKQKEKRKDEHLLDNILFFVES